MELDSNDAELSIQVGEDSDSDLQALFDSVLKPDSARPLSIPFRMRKLPNSFFTPPPTGSKSPITHSRENSADSAFGSSNCASPTPTILTVTMASPLPPTTHSSSPTSGTSSASASSSSSSNSVASNSSASSLSSSTSSSSVVPSSRLAIAHSRAHSSPATLEQTYAVNRSLLSNRHSNLNSNLNTSAVALTATNANLHHHPHTQPQYHIKQRSYDFNVIVDAADELGPLPPGYEQARTPEGQIYYLNHITRSTTWEDPRKSNPNLQLSNAPSVDKLHSSTSNLNSLGSAILACNNKASERLGPLPEGWEQAVTPEGDVYYINHITRSTSWFDPRIHSRLISRLVDSTDISTISESIDTIEDLVPSLEVQINYDFLE